MPVIQKCIHCTVTTVLLDQQYIFGVRSLLGVEKVLLTRNDLAAMLFWRVTTEASITAVDSYWLDRSDKCLNIYSDVKSSRPKFCPQPRPRRFVIGLLCGALSPWAWPTVIGFLFFRGSLVTRWEAPGGFGASCGLWLANFSFSTLMLLVGSFHL